MVKHFNIIVKGKVQGVFYRQSTHKQASKLGLKGFVKNLTNGDVFIEAEGEEHLLGLLIEWCRQGPSAAKVEEVIIEESEVANFQDFTVKG